MTARTTPAAPAFVTSRAAPAARIPSIDALRGAAILGVVLFHLVWDLAYLGFIPPHWSVHPAWVAFGRTLAATFMTLVGVSLVLATRSGVAVARLLRRLGIVALSAVGITVVTWLAFPDAWVWFGILHAIVVATLVGLAFLRAPTAVAVVAGAAVVAAGLLFQTPLFDGRALAWIGFAAAPPPSNDLVPVFPWVGFTLIGIGIARVALRKGWTDLLPVADGSLGRGLRIAGRWSLAIYLVHQPVLLGVLVPLAMLRG